MSSYQPLRAARLRATVLLLGGLCLAGAATASSADSVASRAERPPIRPMRTAGLATDLAAILLSGQEGGDLPIAVLATPTVRPEGGLSLPLSLEIDIGVLFDFAADQNPSDGNPSDSNPSDSNPSDGTARASETVAGKIAEPNPERLDIVAYVLGADGSTIQDTLIQAYDIDVERLSTSRRGLQFVAELKMPRPPGTVRLLVRLQQREALAVTTIPVTTIPATTIPETASTASNVGIPEAEAAMATTSASTTSASTTSASTAAKPLLTPPLIPGGDGWIRLPWILPSGVLPPLPELFAKEAPAARAVLVRGQPLHFQMLAADLGSIGSAMTLELMSSDGRLAGQVKGDVTGYSAPAGDRRRRIEASVSTDGLPLGTYDFTALLTAGENEVRSPALQVLVIDEAAPSEASAPSSEGWPWVIARLTAPSAPTLATGNDLKTAVNQRQLVKSLDEVYDNLAGGEVLTARRLHLKLATLVADDHGSLGLKALGKEEYQRAQLLTVPPRGGKELSAEERAEAVLPLASLNLELYREMRRLGRTLISTHARFMTLRLTELYLEKAGATPLAKKTAATLLVSLGGELQLADMVYFSERMFRKALSIDAEQPTALLALGMNYQLIGDVQRASDTFKALLALEPGHVEAGLRLARLELSEGHQRSARSLLSRAAKGDGPEWARSVAYQELARLDIDAGELESAQSWLEQGIAALPGEPRLEILLAFVFDAEQQPEEAQAVLARATGRRTKDTPSSRRRFGEWSRESFVINDRHLQERVDAALGVFAAQWKRGGKS